MANSIFLRNLANLITAVGIILGVWANMLLWGNSPHYFLIFLLVLVVGFSDLFDGWVARRNGIITPLGAFLDKFRDKSFTCPLFLYFLVQFWQESGDWPALIKGLILLILFIEVFLVLFWVVGFIKGLDISVHFVGKLKMVFYVGIIIWLLINRTFETLIGLGPPLKNYFYLSLVFLLSVAAILAILSMVEYLQRYSKK
jgi:CDP-diacylglycerol--glycerol-3-phosphate 3-phosphatidyltransferase